MPRLSVVQMEGLVPPSIGHDFMFSESELSDILEFMQRSDADGATGPNALGPPPFLGSTAPTSLALSMQFLPHAPEELPLGMALPMQSPAPSYSSDEVFVKAEGCDARGALAQGMASVNGSTSQLFPAVPQLAGAVAARPRAPLPRGTDACAGFAERAHGAGKKGAPALTHACCTCALVILPLSCAARSDIACGESCMPHAAAESKSHVSHSTVEKQRRDRINSLIDEVRLHRPSLHSAPDACREAQELTTLYRASA